MLVFACNVGSTSLKFKLFDMSNEVVLAKGRVESIGSATGSVYEYENINKKVSYKEKETFIENYQQGIQKFLDNLIDLKLGAVANLKDINIISFKTILAKNFLGVHELNDEVIQAMYAYMNVAGSHNGPYIQAIQDFKKLLPNAMMIGVFETAFHTTIPLENRLYSIPYAWYEKYGIQQMGYHGASHAYIAQRAIKYISGDRIISCHLGGSCSICAIKDGKSFDTSYGFSLQSGGIPHATRVGNVDPYIFPFLLSEGFTLDEIDQQLKNNSGLLGLSGISGDYREVEQAALSGNKRAQLAEKVFIVGIIRWIGAYYAEMGGLDGLVFTGGIGENAYMLRQKICELLSHLGIVLDVKKNNSQQKEKLITSNDSKIQVAVIPTDEEVIIARKAMDYYQSHMKK